MMLTGWRALLGSVSLVATVALCNRVEAEGRFGKIGDPIKLVVGYQPYYTPTWSAAVLRALRLHERYLPVGSSVEFQIAIQGAGLITTALQNGSQSLGYLGSAPAVWVASHAAPDGASMSIVASAGFGRDLCNLLLVRADAPQFATTRAALQWLGQRTVSVPFGSCAHAFALDLLERAPVQPRAVIDQAPDLIRRSFAIGRIDAAAVWEPFASQLQEAGLARVAVSGAALDRVDGAFIVVRNDLLRARPDVVEGWLRAELEAQRFLADPGNRQAVVRIIAQQTSGLSANAIQHALYDSHPSVGQRLTWPFDLTPAAMQLLDLTAGVLSRAGRVADGRLAQNAVHADLARKILDSVHAASTPGLPSKLDPHVR